MFDKPTRRQRIAGIAAAFALPAPIAAYLIGHAWVSIAMGSDAVPQGTMVLAFLLFVGVAFIAVPTALFSLVVIVVEELGKRKRR